MEVVLRWIQSVIWSIIIIIVWSIYESVMVNDNNRGATLIYFYLHLIYGFFLILGILSLIYSQKFNNLENNITYDGYIQSIVPFWMKLKFDVRLFWQNNYC